MHHRSITGSLGKQQVFEFTGIFIQMVMLGPASQAYKDS